MNNSQMLDSNRFPLNGVRLIEASAGTGKTYTLAALYLRLVLGQGDRGECYSRPLTPPEILVVTFTNAATLELRDRIRGRLSEAAIIFRGLAEPKPEDEFLIRLLAHYDEEKARAQAARLLERAANWMDEAAIFTIHGWAQRMLRQHAFDSGSGFEMSLQEQDEGDQQLLSVARDYWRIFCTALPSEQAGAFESLLVSPERLAKQVDNLLTRDAPLVYQGMPVTRSRSPQQLSDEFSHWQAQLEKIETSLLGLWRSEGEEIASLLRAISVGTEIDGKPCRFNGTKIKKATLEKQIDALTLWAQQGERPDKPEGVIGYFQFTPEKMNKSEPPVLSVTPLVDAWIAHYQTRPDLIPVLGHALEWIAEQFAKAKAQREALSFDDLLLHLAKGLERDLDGALHRRIRQQFPVAMIDEFQDTDPLQYQIFKTLYLNQPDLALLMIGDPKQAIYSFRGADIHTYLRAREDAGANLYNLPKNYRSSSELVTAVNGVFELAEQRADVPQGGAFKYRSESDNPIPFVAVDAQGLNKPFLLQGKNAEGMSVMLYEGSDDQVDAAEFKQSLALICADRISEILHLARKGEAVIGDRPVNSGDIAVLVRSGADARIVRAALDRLGISSVYLSDKESIFETAEALDLWRWLNAVANPQSPRLMLSALSTPTLELESSYLLAIQNDEQLWEQEVETFIGFAELWRRAGVLALLRALLEHYQLPQRLLKRLGGERTLTNLLHLAELLQTEARKVDGEQGLIRYLVEQIMQPSEAGDQRVVRLESDASRVQVITLHKSKGLEYPLVFIPFAVGSPQAPKYAEGLFSVDESGQETYQLGTPVDAIKEQLQLDQAKEAIRLLYVGLTRPKYACWIGVAKIRGVEQSALGRLIGLGKSDSPAQFAAQIQSLQRIPHLAVEGVIAPTELRMAPEAQSVALEPARMLKRPAVTERWRLTSYSALASGASHRSLSSDTPAQDQYLEMSGEQEQPPERTPKGIHAFPKGAQPGTYLHAVLERCAEIGFAEIANQPERFKQMLQLEQQPSHWHPFESVLERWLSQMLCTPLPFGEHKTSLAELREYKAEMEFWFSLSSVSLTELDQLCSQAVLPGCDRPALQAQQVEGMLKGFIDLTLLDASGYWIADYKSNWLGVDDRSYSKAAMEEALLGHRYDLQLLIYLLALHRLLLARDAGYAADPKTGYDNRIGGAAYLFLRGIDASDSAGVLTIKPDYLQMEKLNQMFEGA